MGWDSSARTVFKDVLSKGLCGSFQSCHRARLEKAVSELLGGKRKIFLFSKKKEAIQGALLLDAQSASVYKPFNGVDYSAVKNVVIEPPFPWTGNFFILASRDLEADNILGAEIPFAQEAFPAALCAAAARSIYDLICALKVRQEKDFFVYDKVLTKFFERRSCWLRPKIPQEKYDDFVLASLDAGVVVSPEFNVDSIVPFGAAPGVLKKMESVNV